MKKSATPKLANIPAWSRVLLALVSICVTILILELVVRLLPPPYGPDQGTVALFNDQADILTCDKNLGWIGTPNFAGSIELSGSRTNLSFNSLGMHDTEHLPEKPPHTFRIFMLGDSFIYAIQVDETATAHQVLEDYLNQSQRANPVRFEVLSSGVSGWGTAQQLFYYREQGPRFQPDLVLLMLFLGNDFQNNLPGKALTIDGFNCYAPYFTLCDGQLNPDPLKYAPGINNQQNNCSPSRRQLINATGMLYQNSRLYQQLDPLITSYHPRQMFGQEYPHPFWALYADNDEIELEQAWQVTLAIIAQLQHEVEADGARFAVAFFPYDVIINLSLLSPVEQAALIAENPISSTIDPNRPNQRLAKFLGEQNIPFIDLTIPLVNHQATQAVSLHFPGDAHWTVEGNRFVADTLAQWLTQNNLLPEP